MSYSSAIPQSSPVLLSSRGRQADASRARIVRVAAGLGLLAIVSVSSEAAGRVHRFMTLAGLAGSSGSADGTGSAARFNFPESVAADPAGNVYVADTLNHTIRKITPAGTVGTLAGLTGSAGSADGTGSAARFYFPASVAVDLAGNVYVADIFNNTIRKITPAGTVSTLAGQAGSDGTTDGLGSAARFSGPKGVAVDTAANVYVADFYNSTIRKITPAGEVTTLAGLAGSFDSVDGIGSAARFSGPNDVAVDAAGNVYVADLYNSTIRKITPAGSVSTLAGLALNYGSEDGFGSAARFSFPAGISLDTAGNIYVADSNNYTVRKITPEGAVSTLAGLAGTPGSTDGTGSAARFAFLLDVAVDAAGNLYVADSENNTIRKAITTVAQRVSIDYDGDSKADPAVYRPSSRSWHALASTTGFSVGTTTSFGLSGDLPVPGDYDGDGTSDLALYRPASGTWYLRLSGTGAVASHALGTGTDIPVPGDYDADGRTDVAIYRWPTGVWSVLTSSSSYTAVLTVQWGLNGDVPVPGDYDGDGTTDRAVFRRSNGTWYISRSSTGTPFVFQWGLNGDIPVPGDYDGDSHTDLAVFRPSAGLWFLLQSGSGFTSSSTFQWGLPTDAPVPGDYDGDGTTDLAVYRPATGTWYVRQSSTGYTTSVNFQWGVSTDIPVSNGTVAMAIAIPRRTVANLTRTADLDGDGKADLTVYRPSTGAWLIPSVLYFLGQSGDVPVPNDYDGDGTTDLAVFRPANGTWYIRTSGTSFTATQTLQWGLSGDVPVPGDYDGDGKADPAVYRRSTGTWHLRLSSTNYTTSSSFQWGLNNDVPLTGDYDGDGATDLVVWRPSTGTWFIRQSSTGYATSVALQFGLSGDIPVPADYDGDGRTDLGVYRPSNGTWILLGSGNNFTGPVSIQFGVSTDTPVPADFNGDGRTDLAVYRASTGVWYRLMSSTSFTPLSPVQWGLSSDIPTFKRP